MKKIIISQLLPPPPISECKSGTGTTKISVILTGEKSGELFFEVAEKYGKFFAADRADCFVLALLPQAAIDGVDIESRVPVSERLLFQLNTFLCGVLAEVYKQRKIKITAPIISERLENAGAVGTGLTCGVDSLYSIAEYSKTPFPSQNLTHLCLFNVGSHNIGAEEPTAMEAFRIKLAERFCEKNGYEFLRINSNVHDFSPNYARYFTVLNAAAAMALPKLFSSYYSSSGLSVSEFHLTGTDLAHFEIFVLDCLSTESLKFYSTGAEVSRFEKVKALSMYSPSYEFLNVCNTHAQNCGVCIKCLRTLYALDILDSLDKYSSVFDVEAYRKNHTRFLAECWVRKVFAKDIFCMTMWPMLRKKYGVPLWNIVSESIRFVRSRLKIYSFSYIRYRLRDSKKH